mmetsp:Transcript_9781/g.26484  ORF Transcript_9781/g.26484 Transcript_9781/m.26484 type:complete len:81 (+) Transcript_9781:675-917(+)
MCTELTVVLPRLMRGKCLAWGHRPSITDQELACVATLIKQLERGTAMAKGKQAGRQRTRGIPVQVCCERGLGTTQGREQT